jgi:hypothetical protein
MSNYKPSGYKIGDRVEYRSSQKMDEVRRESGLQHYRLKIGLRGTVIRVYPWFSQDMVTVEFDESIDRNAYDLKDRNKVIGRYYHCDDILSEELRKLTPEELAEEQREKFEHEEMLRKAQEARDSWMHKDTKQTKKVEAHKEVKKAEPVKKSTSIWDDDIDPNYHGNGTGWI